MFISAIVYLKHKEGPELRGVARSYWKYTLNQLRYHLICRILSFISYLIQMTVYLPEL